MDSSEHLFVNDSKPSSLLVLYNCHLIQSLEQFFTSKLPLTKQFRKHRQKEAITLLKVINQSITQPGLKFLSSWLKICVCVCVCIPQYKAVVFPLTSHAIVLVCLKILNMLLCLIYQHGTWHFELIIKSDLDLFVYNSW